MSDFFNIFLLFCAVLTLIFLLNLFFRNCFSHAKSQERRGGKNLKTQKTKNGGVDFVRCPLCSTPLAYGENLVSRIFRPMNTPDQRMTVLGCPHCYPAAENKVQRICPVCKKNVPADGYLIARLFNREKNKKHVMITGCTVCSSRQK